MIYTNKHVPQYVYDGRSNSLQTYYIKIEVGTRPADIQWPLQVFGVVAVRDSIDSMRNIIFYRDRDDCQTLTEEVCIVFLLMLHPCFKAYKRCLI